MYIREFPDTDKLVCRILFDVIEHHGVRDVVCSPGSRNAPLIIAAAARESLRKHVLIDERSGAFMALGISVVSRNPVGLVCTSGTALLNYAPAVAEAYYQGIPLIVISADRPRQWIDQDDSQTIRQFESLSNFVKKSYDLSGSEMSVSELEWYANRIVNEAMLEAKGGRPGPVHINVRLEDPLGKKVIVDHPQPRIIQKIEGDIIGDKEEINRLARELAQAKVMLTAGFLPPDAKLQKGVADFASLPNVVVMAETISNLHLSHHAHCVDTILSGESSQILDEISPDIVISIGGALVSRKLKEFLRRNSSRISHWSLGPSNSLADCFKSMTLKIDCDPARFLRNLTPRIHKYMNDKNQQYNSLWSERKESAIRQMESFIKQAEWSELKAFNRILKEIPRNYNLFLSNGTPIRYAQIIDYHLPHASYCNRGVSGIDGSVSTAIGGAKVYKNPTLLITGDLSMAYDISALSLPEIPSTMKIIVIDNCGGGIFRFIPTTSGLEELEHYFCAAPKLPLQQLCKGYGWSLLEAENDCELKESLDRLWTSREKTVLRVVCPPGESARILKSALNI